jgi:thiazole synthase
MRNKFDKLQIGDKSFSSRLMLGTGKYRTVSHAINSIEASQTEMVTVAVRRLPTNLDNDNTVFLKSLDWQNLWLLPNTAGSQTAEEAIRMAFLGHELACQLGQPENFFVKLEVISDPKYLLPDPVGTLKAAEFLIKKGFTVLPYINADPMLALHLEDIGCATVMPLGSPIGSGQGLNNLANIQIIIENSNIPVVIDAGIGKPSEATSYGNWSRCGFIKYSCCPIKKSFPNGKSNEFSCSIWKARLSVRMYERKKLCQGKFAKIECQLFDLNRV